MTPDDIPAGGGQAGTGPAGGGPSGQPPDWLTGRLEVPTEVPLCVRPLCPDDAALERRFIDRLAPETLQQRLLGVIKEPTDEQIALLVAQDWPRSLALAVLRCGTAGAPRPAADPAPEPAPGPASAPDDEPEILAVARFHPADDRPGAAEFAIVVADDWQRKGLGHALFERLVHAARVAGLRELFGTTFADNRGMIDLARAMGFEVGPEPDEPALRRMTLAL